MFNLSYISPQAAVKASPIHGRGLFAKDSIAKGEIVCIKGGHIFNRAKLREIQKTLGPAEIQIGENLFIDPLTKKDLQEKYKDCMSWYWLEKIKTES